MEKIKENLTNNENYIFEKRATLLRPNLNVKENHHNEEIHFKTQDENLKTSEKQLEKLQYNEYIPQCKLKTQTVLNQFVDVVENGVINTQMKEAAIDTSLKNELLLLNNQLDINPKEKLELLQEREHLETEFQNEKVLAKEAENEMNSTGYTISALKDFYSTLEHNYTNNSNDLSSLKNSEERIYSTRKQLYKVYDTKKAEIIKSQQVLVNIEDENDQLTLETNSYREKVNALENLYNDKEQAYSMMNEEYNQELNKHQELLNCYKTEENINDELKGSLESLCIENLISERDNKQKEIELNLQSHKQIADEISNNVRKFSKDKEKKKREMDEILKEITENIKLIDKKENEIGQLQTKITDCDKSITKIKYENNKIICDLQKEIEYAQSKLHDTNNATEIEKQVQKTYITNLASDQDRKQELAGMMEKHNHLKNSLNIANNVNMSKKAEIIELQKQLKNKLTENNNLLLILQKENLETEIAFKRGKEQMEEMERKYKKDIEEHENKLYVINNEIITFTQESERVEKQRQEKLQQLMKQNLDQFKQLKAKYADSNRKNEDTQKEINRKKTNLKVSNEKLLKEVQKIKHVTVKSKIKKTTATGENKLPNVGILKKTMKTSRFPRKKVTFSPVSDYVYNISSNNENQSPERETTPLLQKCNKLDRLFQKLKDDYDKEEALKKKM